MIKQFEQSTIEQCCAVMKMISKLGYDNSKLTIGELITIKNKIVNILETTNQDNTNIDSEAGFQGSNKHSDGLSGFRG